MNISDQEQEIFSRHLILKEFNDLSFNKLQQKKITLVGVGGIGCPAAQYLVTAGIKNLKLIDSDVVEKNNLNRQILFSIHDIGKYKTNIAKKNLNNINPECNIDCFSKYLDKKNIDIVLKDSSLIIDSTDNWETMTLINKYCVENSIPLISASVVGFDSQVILFKNLPNKHLCLQCIFPNNNEPDISRCDIVGVMGTAAGMAGLIVAQKAINLFLEKNFDDNYITMVSIKSLKIENIRIKTNFDCKHLKKNN